MSLANLCKPGSLSSAPVSPKPLHWQVIPAWKHSQEGCVSHLPRNSPGLSSFAKASEDKNSESSGAVTQPARINPSGKSGSGGG